VERSVTFIPDEVDVRIGNVPVEGEIEDFEKIQDELEEGNQPIPQPAELEHAERPNLPLPEPPVYENQDADADVPAQPEIVAEEDTGGQGKRIWKESSYIRHIREGENAIAMPRGLQTVPERAGEGAETAGVWEAQEEDWAMATVMNVAEDLEPSYEEAQRRSDWPRWQEAIKAELASLEKNGTWSVVERPKGVNVVGCKWVLRIKKNTAGEI